MEEKKIASLTISEIGKVFCRHQVQRTNKSPNETTWITVEEPIERFTVNGEMALVSWYRQGKKEWNGKFVIEVEYE